MQKPQRPYPLIGINTDYIPAGKTSGAFNRIHAGYAESVYAANAIPVLIPPTLKEDKDLEELLDRLDGVIMTGSSFDLDPRRRKLPMHAAITPMPEKREAADFRLGKLVMERQKPLLAVGVGLHELNVLRNGTLVTHLPEDRPKALPHKDPSGGPHRHVVTVEPGTRIADIYGTEEILVNSFHNQAIDQLGEGLRVSALSPDGVIEAVESDDPDWFCVGVQWHPHSETASALDQQLFEAFIKSCGVQHEIRLLKLAA